MRELGSVALVTAAASRRAALAAVEQRQRPEIGEHARAASGVRLHVLLRKSRSASGAVEDRRQRAIGEVERKAEGLRGGQRLAGLRPQRARDADGKRACEPAGEVHEVAALAEQAAAPVLGVVEPVVRGQPAGVDAEEQLERHPGAPDALP